MSVYRTSELSQILSGQLIGNDVSFSTFSIDSRTLKFGECFVAIVGPNFDGHNFIAQAIQNGAVAAIVSSHYDQACAIPLLKVDNPRLALGKLARWKRQQNPIPTVAVTGSMGKTTTKEMVASILRVKHPNLLVTPGNRNNDLGLPLTLLNHHQPYDYAVLEMGADHVGEIAYLTDIVHPAVAIITTVSTVHLEKFGTVDNIAKTKGEIIQGVLPDGFVVLPNENTYFSYWEKQLHGQSLISFGYTADAAIWASDITSDSNSHPSFQLHLPETTLSITLQVLGEHQVHNALAAASAAYALGISSAEIQQGLQNYQPFYHRLVECLGYKDSTIIDDSYNASPLAVHAALRILAKRSGYRIFVFGDMRELAEIAESAHKEVGVRARELGINELWAVGDLAGLAADTFGDHGRRFSSREAVINALRERLDSNVTILVKGSLSTKMTEVVKALCC